LFQHDAFFDVMLDRFIEKSDGKVPSREKAIAESIKDLSNLAYQSANEGFKRAAATARQNGGLVDLSNIENDSLNISAQMVVKTFHSQSSHAPFLQDARGGFKGGRPGTLVEYNGERIDTRAFTSAIINFFDTVDMLN
jgi:hypothetical protein